jgi:predicted dinucleotide-binding enzyme
MKIGLLGGGSVGEALGVAWAKQGHEILFGVGHPDSEEVEALLARCGPAARAGTLTEAARFGEVLAVALPWQAAYDVLPTLDLTGKIVIDCSNPLTNLPEGVASGAEALARRSPGARFAKAFNTTGAENMADPHQTMRAKSIYGRPIGLRTAAHGLQICAGRVVKAVPEEDRAVLRIARRKCPGHAEHERHQ